MVWSPQPGARVNGYPSGSLPHLSLAGCRGPQTHRCPQVPGIWDTKHAKRCHIFMMSFVRIKQGTLSLLLNQRQCQAKIVSLVQMTTCQYCNTTLFCSFMLPVSLPASILQLVCCLAAFNIHTNKCVNLVSLPIKTTRSYCLKSKPQFPLCSSKIINF